MNSRQRVLMAGFLVTALMILGSGSAAAQSIRLSGLRDVNFPRLELGRDAQISQDLCVFSDANDGAYHVTATGSSAGSQFALDGIGHPLPIALMWNAEPGSDEGETLVPGRPLGGLISRASDPDCATGPSASATLIVRIRAADIGRAIGGIGYFGTITLSVGPE